ncbi:MAG: conjugal transfer protein TraF [Endomicrobium sp.]|jgi:hypothetical protein|nr:conjugal transfer protein TraF [Endomicrobium sp.]
MKKTKFLMSFVMLCAIFSKTIFAVTFEENIVIKGLRPMGMGGAFTAISDDENSFFYNPAGISAVYDNTLQIFSINANINNYVQPTYAFCNKHIDDFMHFDELEPSKQGSFVDKIYKSILNFKPSVFISIPNIFFIKSPIDINRNSLNFGFGVFSYAKAALEFNKGAFLPSLSYNLEATGIGLFPVAYRIHSLNALNLPGVLSLGINFKYAYRLINSKQNLSINEISSYDFGGNFFDATAFGLDFGVLYYLNPRWHFGVNTTDLYNSQFNYKKSNLVKVGKNEKETTTKEEGYSSKINPILNIGFAYIPEKFYYWPGKYLDTNSNITFAFDLTDLTNPSETVELTPFKKIHMGAEYRLNPLSLRTGLNSGYPTFGMGINLKAVNLEYAFYGQEKGLLPGQDPDWTHSFLLSFRLRWSNTNTTNKEEKQC